MGWGIACALTSWRRLGGVARVPALVLGELPFLAGYVLIASMVLALAQGDLDSVGGVIIGVVALVELLGLTVIVRRALRADGALHNPTPPRRPWRRILLAPLPAFRRDVVRIETAKAGAAVVVTSGLAGEQHQRPARPDRRPDGAPQHRHSTSRSRISTRRMVACDSAA